MAWDLFKQQPIMLVRPDGLRITVAAVTPVGEKSYYVWNADYVISANMPGRLPNSGFAFSPFEDVTPVFSEEDNSWSWDSEGEHYVFKLPIQSIMDVFEGVKQFCPSIEALTELAQRDAR